MLPPNLTINQINVGDYIVYHVLVDRTVTAARRTTLSEDSVEPELVSFVARVMSVISRPSYIQYQVVLLGAVSVYVFTSRYEADLNSRLVSCHDQPCSTTSHRTSIASIGPNLRTSSGSLTGSRVLPHGTSESCTLSASMEKEPVPGRARARARARREHP